jgi:DNA (cytosine-5)-methyltransferase 1
MIRANQGKHTSLTVWPARICLSDPDAMPRREKIIPIIDIFAGPGGLSEGFNSREAASDGVRFSSVLSIEKDSVASATLKLRSFFHQFWPERVPEAYYEVVRGERPQTDLFKYPEWKKASERVWNAELGKVPVSELHGRIAEKLGAARDWVLLGGPPCQAYSLIGRARMTGVGHDARTSGKSSESLRLDRLSKFSKDVRHTLYREYLRIVAVHQPAVFVMENVKGILSSRVNPESGLSDRVFPRIRRDLSSPWEALGDDPLLPQLKKFRKGGPRRYRLYSFVTNADDDDIADSEFLIRCEQYGIPQARHRVVLLGIRDDFKSRPRALRERPAVSVRNAIESMPALRSGLSKEADTAKGWQDALRACFAENRVLKLGDELVQKTVYKVIGRTSVRLTRGAAFIAGSSPPVSASLRRWLTDSRLGGILQHESRSHMNSDLGRYLFASATAARINHSPRLSDWPVFLLPNHRNVDSYRIARRDPESMFVDRFKVQIWDKPSSTVTSHISKDGHYFIHPDPFQCRSLTVREAARLQTFPDNYFFCGNRTQQYHQVGNAVPPFLASQMADVVAEFLISGGGSKARGFLLPTTFAGDRNT